MGAREMLEQLGMDPDEAVAEDKRIREAAVRSRSICICGHAEGRHEIYNGVTYCKPTRMECKCRKLRKVVDANDVRYFVRKTTGPGTQHALVRGLSALIEKNIDAEWTIELECDKCKSKNGTILPCPVTANGVITNEDTGFNALLCENCLGGSR